MRSALKTVIRLRGCAGCSVFSYMVNGFMFLTIIIYYGYIMVIFFCYFSSFAHECVSGMVSLWSVYFFYDLCAVGGIGQSFLLFINFSVPS